VDLPAACLGPVGDVELAVDVEWQCGERTSAIGAVGARKLYGVLTLRAIHAPPSARERRRTPRSLQPVVDWLLRQLQPGHACYEAGPTGFGLCRPARAAGLRLDVVAPTRCAGGPDQTRPQSARQPGKARRRRRPRARCFLWAAAMAAYPKRQPRPAGKGPGPAAATRKTVMSRPRQARSDRR
jgi:hypothetical protein